MPREHIAGILDPGIALDDGFNQVGELRDNSDDYAQDYRVRPVYHCKPGENVSGNNAGDKACDCPLPGFLWGNIGRYFVASKLLTYQVGDNIHRPNGKY